MNSEELYTHLISDVMTSPNELKDLVEELGSTERYQKDYEFRAFIETCRAYILSVNGKYSQVIPLSTTLIERSKALELWRLLSINLNLLGNAYFSVEIYERALECYHNVIKNEENHNFLFITSRAYNNLALIYIQVDCYEKTYEYFQLALNALEQGGLDQPLYTSTLCSYLSNLVVLLCQMNQTEKALSPLGRIRAIDPKELNFHSTHSYYAAEMYYAFYTGNYERGKSFYYQAKDLIPKDDILRQMDFLYGYVFLCELFHLDYDFYASDLLLIEDMGNSEHIFINVQMYTLLRKYYEKVGNDSQLKKTTQKYMELLEKNAEHIRKKQLDSLQLVTDLIHHSESIADISSENTELKLIAQEATQHKNALQEAYNRIEMINEIGQKMTSSLKLSEVVDLIYQNLKTNVPTGNFLLMVAEPECNQLRSVAYYDNDKLQNSFCISLDNDHSIFVECYKTNTLIFSNNIQTDQRFKKNKIIQIGPQKALSTIFMPLNVGNHLIGVCSIQAHKAHAYTSKHLLFLKQLLPYLSIALNNAIHSWKLEQEIRSHLKTQFQLEKANHRLELLSSLDGLTQISSRRDFEVKILELLEEAQQKKTPLSLFMIDIDNFKLYNDTYGHLEGDEVLKRVAQTIRHNLDLVHGLSARFGGEEFIGACIGLNAIQSTQLANKIRQDVYDLQIKHISSPLKRVTISVGVAMAKKLALSQKSDIMRWADISLYQAKNKGKNTVVLKKITPDKKNNGQST